MIEMKNGLLFLTAEEIVIIEESIKALKEKFENKLSKETLQIITELETDMQGLLLTRMKELGR